MKTNKLNIEKSLRRLINSLFLLLPFSTTFASSSVKDSSETFDPSEMIAHHIGDDYQFHVVGSLHVPLPVIVYSPADGLKVFLSNKFHGPDHTAVPYEGYYYDHQKIARVDGAKLYNFSITKNVFTMMLVGLLMGIFFVSCARAYEKRKGKAPKGMQSFWETFIIFIRDDVAKASIGEHKYKRYVPYLLTLFFFIWFINLIGLFPLFPGSANVSGNIAFTMALAALSLLVINFSGGKHYWGHIFWPPGIPTPIKFILVPVELVGLIAKPVALMIRLFANMLGGHIVLLSIVSLIFILGPQMGVLGASGISIGSVAFMVFMYMIKLFVAILQAFIFTLLTAIFIGQAVAEEHHEAHEQPISSSINPH